MLKKHYINCLQCVFTLLVGALPMLFSFPMEAWGQRVSQDGMAWGQRVSQDGMALEHFDSRELSFDFSVSDFDFDLQYDGTLLLTSSATNGHSRAAGKPMLPQMQRLLELPTEGDVVVTVEEAVWERCPLPKGSAVLAAAAGARLKGEPMLPAVCDAGCYATDAFYGLPLTEVTPLGSMRSSRLARLTVSPFRYNPVRREREVCRHCRIAVRS